MPTTSDTIPQAIFLETDGGVAAVYANKAAFLAAGWNLSWQDNTGAALASQPTWTLSAGEASGRHVVGFTPPEGVHTVKITIPAGYLSSPTEFPCEATVYSTDDIYGVAVASLATPVTDLTTTGSLDLYDSNSIIIDLSVLEAALTAVGASSLADLTSMTAEIKKTATDSDQPAEVTTLVESIITDTAGARVVRAELDAFPAGLAVPDGGIDQSVSCRCDLRITKGAKTITAATRDITVRWKANS